MVHLTTLAIGLSCVASAAAQLRFLAFGDWGKGGSTGKYGSRELEEVEPLKQDQQIFQMAVAAAMGQFSTAWAPEFVVALGDNFYANGVSSVDDPLWDYLWRDVYLPYAGLNVPWYPVFGNHDYGGGASAVQAQLQRSVAHLDDDLWRFPATNYTKVFAIPNSTATLRIVFVDTTTLAPSVNKCCNEAGGISTAVQEERIRDQMEHLVAMLEEDAKQPATWLLVVGHYPVYTQGKQGDVSQLEQTLVPLMQHYGAQAFLCGHDHMSEHLQLDGVEYFVMGGAAMADQLSSTASKAAVLWTGTGYGAFGALEATAETLTVKFIDTSGDIKYQYVLKNPKNSTVMDDDRPDGLGAAPEEANGESGSEEERRSVMLFVSGGVAVVGLLAFAFVYSLCSHRLGKQAGMFKLPAEEKHGLSALESGTRGKKGSMASDVTKTKGSPSLLMQSKAATPTTLAHCYAPHVQRWGTAATAEESLALNTTAAEDSDEEPFCIDLGDEQKAAHYEQEPVCSPAAGQGYYQKVGTEEEGEKRESPGHHRNFTF